MTQAVSAWPHRVRRAWAAVPVREIAAFLLVGGTGAVLFTVLNVAFTRAGLRPSLSIALTLALLIPPVYLAQHRFTFRSGSGHRTAFPRYLGTQLAGNGLAMLAAELAPEAIRAHPWIAFAILTVLAAVVNYGVLKFWAFRKPTGTPPCPT